MYAVESGCYLRIEKVDPNRTCFYYGRPAHDLTYCGGHSRHHRGGMSFYKARHPKVYRHPVYAGNFHSRPDFRRTDFAPGRPLKGPGYHFTPSTPPRPEARPGKPGHKPDKHPQVKPSRPHKHPVVRPSRPDKPDKRPAVKPARPDKKPQARPHPNRNASKERGDRNLRKI